ncbi:magnesium transporter [Aeromicrobium fastidiosum]|uniref:Uncharacterized protein n=1 Tax=Aeromicrobium fastidiosum TaxID=52699 RepID=A0A641AL10_9ACTN|nr:magnesium transporter [Aeromicrobium fastidiosum]KAA1376370.1 hypothetical protein ESP62_013125 [Aeromicrobium fastidiosum]MBP2391728.1 hypothetical protein [Aeromicrobium fastidiosum]
MPDKTDDTFSPDCGCTDGNLVCAHHQNLYAYKQAFAGRTTARLPVLTVRPTLRTFWSEFDGSRKFLLAILLLGIPTIAFLRGLGVVATLLLIATLIGACALPVAGMLVKKLTLDPANGAVRSRNWRGKTVTLRVDDEMQAAAFQYLALGVTSFAANVVLWTPSGFARLDQRQWGVDNLDDIVFVLGVRVGGVYGDEDIAREFPGVVPAAVMHPRTTAAIGIVVALFLVIGIGAMVAAFNPDHEDDDVGGQRREPTSVEVNGPKPTSLPPEVVARQDALDESLKKALAGKVSWESESAFRPCDEQPGWQRENRYSVQEGARFPGDEVTEAFDAAVRASGLVPVPDDRATNLSTVLSTEYDSPTGAGARAYISAFEATSSYDATSGVSVFTQSDCVITPR